MTGISFLEDFIGSTASLPAELQQNYSLIRQLDEQQNELQRQMHGCCAHGLEDVKQVLKAGGAAAEAVANKYASSIASVHKTCVDVANEKVALALSTYDMVDNYIQRLDKYLKKYKEDCEQAKDLQGGDEQQADVGATGEDDRQNPSTDLDIPVDPNEPTYCLCNQVSYGEMIACDNPDCKIEWFHFECAGVRERPKGKWYCPDCSQMKRRRAR
ncbi:hypothetical protein SELMODRAFT_270360 [Selaginella moellendorffii]|uniref:PHD finger protein ING n=1 Tax=Selaginella moellendorffii TaxID=88036 RepID=D8QY36_SELML|nr:PHD finger protein ING1 [Selaginella moellendorffii]XP_002974758.1 PHD finger protein ING1 [Selaginella moellendorffii]XP_024523196.1 PHD finger protein ING1 [Selaginella moellendorffii]EFJ24278.1 hypothetical protein SELMODRAFT_228279 [Selaginella moellendorffii]EFJ35540.1 hypothetical protein SELMODRAFT_270360 [Selaginella moellendorffii]|eukprot:XP_002963669.1 PHD finger protein ING1 [Selaginella moellendorffii]